MSAPLRPPAYQPRAAIANWFRTPQPPAPQYQLAVRAEVIEHDGGFLLGLYREDTSGELIFCPDSAVLCNSDAINRVLAEHGMRIDVSPNFWRDFGVASMLESIDFRRGLGYGEIYGEFEIRPRERKGGSAQERERRLMRRPGARSAGARSARDASMDALKAFTSF